MKIVLTRLIAGGRLPQLSAAVAIAVLTSACAPSTDDLTKYIAQVKARPSTPIEPVPEMKPFDTFAYPEDVVRDPFRAPTATEVAATSGPRPDTGRAKELLEEYPLDTLRMMGTLQQKGSLWALVRDPDGTIHRVQLGNHLGQNHGRVTYIDEHEVRLVELVPNGSGGWDQRDAALAVQE